MNILKIHRTPSKSGKRIMFYPTVNGMRITRTNYARKYDAEAVLRAFIAHHGEEKAYELTTKGAAA